MSRTASSVGVNHVFPGRSVDVLGKVKAALASLPAWVVSVEERLSQVPSSSDPDLAEWQRSE